MRVECPPHSVVDRGRVEGVGPDAKRAASRGADLGREPFQSALLHVYRHDETALAADDACRRASDARSGRRDQRHLVLEPHQGQFLSATMNGS